MSDRIDRYLEYIESVQSGAVLVPKTIKSLVEWHLSELEKAKAPDYPYYFNTDWAALAITFIQSLKFWQGKWAGKPFTLEPWQQFIVSLIYGWRQSDTGYRRFKTVFFTVARKNGKTILIAALMLLELLLEQGAEIVSVATKGDQAYIAFNHAAHLLNDYLRKRGCRKLKDRILRGSSFLRPFCSDSHTLDGFNPSFVLIDEYHEHKTDDLKNVMESGMGAREQPLVIITTTAGADKNSPCYQEYENAKAILNGIYHDDEYLTAIYELEEGDDPFDETTWIKANPNLGNSPSLDYLRKRVKDAKRKPASLIDFKRKNCNLWVAAPTHWIKLDLWMDAPKFDVKELEGKECYLAIDLSKNGDFTGYSLGFKTSPFIKSLHRFYIPEDTVYERFEKESQSIFRWVDDGYITLCPGSVIDQEMIRDDILKDARTYKILEVLYDPYNAGAFIKQLEGDGFACLEMNQSIKAISPAAKEFERLTLEKKFLHNDNPVLTWMISNAEIYTDANNNIKPIKPDYRKSSKRIDGVVTSVMVTGRIVNLSLKPKFDYSKWEPVKLNP